MTVLSDRRYEAKCAIISSQVELYRCYENQIVNSIQQNIVYVAMLIKIKLLR